MATETTGIEAVQGTGKPATPASPPSQGPVPTGLLSDPAVSALHDAFLIGWSLTELRSRIQTELLKIAAATNQMKKDIFRENGPLWAGALITILVVLGVLFVLLFLIPGLADSLKGLFSGLLVLAVGALGGGSVYARNKVSGVASTTQGQQPPQGNGNAPTTAASGTILLDRFSSFLGSFGSTIMTDFNRGYQQILIEFDNLNHNVSVAFPFIEFFITTPLSFTKEIKDGYDFLTTVIWTEEERSQEIERIAQAAFGPLGALVGAQLLPGQVKYRGP